MNAEQNISSRLDSLCKRYGLTQAQLAAELGAQPSYINQLINGKRTDPGGILLNAINMWEKLRGLRGPAQGYASTVIQEEPPGYAPCKAIPFPASEPPELTARLQALSEQSHIPPDQLRNIAMEWWLNECEKAGHIIVPLKPPNSTSLDHSTKTKGAA